MKKQSDQGPIVSAQVLLQSHSGEKLGEKTAVTAENIAEYLPSAEAVTVATQAFTAAGFDVSRAVGNNFSITAPLKTFEKVFHATFRIEATGAVEVVEGKDERRKKKRDKYRLPLTRLPKSLAQHIEAVTFSAPPDYGPI